MITYQTMTTGGIYGADYVASSAEEAATAAEQDGYTVLDIMNDVLVIAG